VAVEKDDLDVAAFICGFADKSSMQMLQNVTSVIVKLGKTSS
jgi:hypothetical protein